MKNIEQFFKDAFSDMAEGARVQHQDDVANFEAAKMEGAIRFEESKARPARERDAALKRKGAAQARLDQVRAGKGASRHVVQVDPGVLKAFLQNVIVNGSIVGYPRQQTVARERGCKTFSSPLFMA